MNISFDAPHLKELVRSNLDDIYLGDATEPLTVVDFEIEDLDIETSFVTTDPDDDRHELMAFFRVTVEKYVSTSARISAAAVLKAIVLDMLGAE